MMDYLEKKYQWAINAIKEAFKDSNFKVTTQVKDYGHGLLVYMNDGYLSDVINLTGDVPDWPQKVILPDLGIQANRARVLLAIKQTQERFQEMKAKNRA